MENHSGYLYLEYPALKTLPVSLDLVNLAGSLELVNLAFRKKGITNTRVYRKAKLKLSIWHFLTRFKNPSRDGVQITVC